MNADLAPMISDLLRVATLGLFAVSAYSVRELAIDVRKIRAEIYEKGGITERLTRVEERQASFNHGEG